MNTVDTTQFIDGELRFTRRGFLAVHLMAEYHGKKLERAVERISGVGKCRNRLETDAMREANEAEFPDPTFPECGDKRIR